MSHVRVVLARLLWMFFGPAAMIIISLRIAQASSGWFTALDAAYVAIAVGTVAAKWYELASGEGRDAYGKPATIAHFSGFVRSVVPVATCVWILANLVGNHL